MRFAEENKIFGSLLISPCYTDLGIKEEKISDHTMRAGFIITSAKSKEKAIYLANKFTKSKLEKKI